MKRPLLPADPKLHAHLQDAYTRRMRQANRVCGAIGLVLLLWLLGMSLESCTPKASPGQHKGYRPRKNTPSWSLDDRHLETARPRQ